MRENSVKVHFGTATTDQDFNDFSDYLFSYLDPQLSAETELFEDEEEKSIEIYDEALSKLEIGGLRSFILSIISSENLPVSLVESLADGFKVTAEVNDTLKETYNNRDVEDPDDDFDEEDDDYLDELFYDDDYDDDEDLLADIDFDIVDEEDFDEDDFDPDDLPW